MDSTVDPVAEEQRKKRALLAGLTNGDFPSRGPKDARVTLTIFSDFQCPYCARLAQTLNTVLPSEAKTTRVVFRYFPLTMHDWARKAAEAAACVQEQGDSNFWQLHDFLFGYQSEFTPDSVIARITEETKHFRRFDTSRFATCVATKRTSSKVDRDIAFGTRSEVNATPTVFVNGELAGPITAPEQLRTLIREAAAKQAVTTSAHR